MHIIVESSIHTLKKSEALLSKLSNDQLSDHSVAPYYSCIGSHIRHIIDFYNCALKGVGNSIANLTLRTRDQKMHNDCEYAIYHINDVIKKLSKLNGTPMNLSISVIDDLGLGKVEMEYTLGSLLAQANSHAIHHYAIISYILDRLEVSIEDESFGFNPTTPRPEINLN